MISWGDFYNVMSAMVPLYVDMLLAYGSVRWWKIFTPEQCVGINRFVAVFAVPLLSFHFLSANDPYNMNLRFLAADTLQKIIILVGLLLWAHFSRRHDSMDWLITLFSVSTLPNTLIMGIPLLGGMYTNDAKALMIQIVVLQCIIWYTLLLFLFEYRDAMKLIAERFPGNAGAIASVTVESDVISLRDGETDSHVDNEGRIHVTVRKSTSSYRSPGRMTPRSSFTPQPSHPASGDLHGTTPRISTFSSGEFFGSSYGLAELYRTPKAPVSPAEGSIEPENIRGRAAGKQQSQVNIDIHESHKFARSTSAPPAGSDWAMEGKELSFARGRGGGGGEEEEERERMSNLGEIRSGAIGESPDTAVGRPPAMVMTGIILNMVWRKLIRNPNTYSSLLGLAWSLIEFRFDVRLPAIVDNSIAILSSTGLGMAMFSLGLFMALQPKLIACGNWMALLSFGVRFVFGPAVMAVASLAVGLRGHLFRIAVVQAALPQGIVPFVFAKEYDLHPTILSTGVIFGLIVALPIDLLYYVLLEL